LQQIQFLKVKDELGLFFLSAPEFQSRTNHDFVEIFVVLLFFCDVVDLFLELRSCSNFVMCLLLELFFLGWFFQLQVLNPLTGGFAGSWWREETIAVR
jgi:hypothetical protein